MKGLLLAAVIAAGVLAATAAAGPPPPLLAHIAVTHARPVAGHTFTGVTITPVGTTIENVTCPARIRHANLPARKQRFYDGDFGLIAIACSWHVPASARGKLSTRVTVVTDNGTLASPNLTWRVRSRPPG